MTLKSYMHMPDPHKHRFTARPPMFPSFSFKSYYIL